MSSQSKGTGEGGPSPYDERRVTIDDRLEARVSAHPPSSTGWCAVLTHPHPKLGGDLHNNVVEALRITLNELGVATVRFNTRGVGKSLGSSTWTGTNEREDVRAAVEFANRMDGVNNVALVAYSFGAAVGLSISADLVKENKLHAVVCVGYPKGFFAQFIFSHHYPRIDPQSSIPKLFVIGDSDNFTSTSTMRALVDKVTDPKQLVVIEGADHFCFEQEDLITLPVSEFFKSHVLNTKVSSRGSASASSLM